MKRWKLVSQKTILRTDLFDVKQINFETKTGRKKIQHIAERIPVVCVFPITDEYEIYLISQYRYMLGKTVLEAVAGYIEKKESTIAAARRELEEETGITALQFEEIARIEMAGSAFRSKLNLFLAKGLQMGQNDLDDDEEISVVKMPLDQAVEKVMNGEINHSASMLGILLLDKLRLQKKL